MGQSCLGNAGGNTSKKQQEIQPMVSKAQIVALMDIRSKQFSSSDSGVGITVSMTATSATGGDDEVGDTSSQIIIPTIPSRPQPLGQMCPCQALRNCRKMNVLPFFLMGPNFVCSAATPRVWPWP